MSQYLGVLPVKNELRWVHVKHAGAAALEFVASKKVVFPEFGSRDKELGWAYMSVVDAFSDVAFESVCVVQGSQSQSGAESVLLRAQVEGVALAALASLKMDVISVKKSGMIKAFGLKRGAGVASIPGLPDLRDKNGLPKYFDEAIAAALTASL
jgi:hypothetical protein